MSISISLFDFNYCGLFFFQMGNFYIKQLAIVDCLKLGKVIALKMFLKFTVFFPVYGGT